MHRMHILFFIKTMSNEKRFFIFRNYSKLLRRSSWYSEFIFPYFSWMVLLILCQSWAIFGHSSLAINCFVTYSFNGFSLLIVLWRQSKLMSPARFKY